VAKYQRFEELPVWQEAARLYNLVLDLLDEHGALLSSGFRNQLDRAALSVSNNIAEGFERVTTNELLSFLAIARGSSGEVRSMIAVVHRRPRLKRLLPQFGNICSSAESCSRQITGWAASIEDSPIDGKRHLTGSTRARKEAAEASLDLRRQFLLSIAPQHPLYSTPEAVAARAAGQLDGRDST
jgi:four helix bundle protein